MQIWWWRAKKRAILGLGCCVDWLRRGKQNRRPSHKRQHARGDWHPDGKPVTGSQTGNGNPMGRFVESLSRSRVWAVLK